MKGLEGQQKWEKCPGKKTKLNWYGHALSREKEYVGKLVIGMDVEGRARKQEMDG